MGSRRERREKGKRSRSRERWIREEEKRRRSGRRKALGIISKLVDVDLTIINEPCVLLTTETCYLNPVGKVIAWFPERQLVGVVSNTLLSYDYVPLASCSDMVCGMHIDDVLNFETMDRTFRLQVCNPATRFCRELPPLEDMQFCFGMNGGTAHLYGTLGVLMTPATGDDDENRFSVHVISHHRRSQSKAYTVYTFNSGSEAWESSTRLSSGTWTSHLVGDIIFWDSLERKIHGYDVRTRSWTAVPGPSWDDIPLPSEFLDCRYARLDIFRYGSKIMMAGQCAKGRAGEEEKAGMVVLEMQEDGSTSTWKVIASVSSYKFDNNGYKIPETLYTSYKPLVGGNLLVFHNNTHRERPVAFHLEHHTWLEVPADLSLLPLESTCVYT